MKLHKNKTTKKCEQYARRKFRTNTAIKGQQYDIRILVKKSLNHITSQVINKAGDVLATVSDKSLDWQNKTERAFAAGKLLADKIQSPSVEKVVFDRNGFLYHGKIKAFADGLREGGVNI